MPEERREARGHFVPARGVAEMRRAAGKTATLPR